MIDDLTYSYNPQRTHLVGVEDNAPLPGRDKGFKPKPGAGAYLYDDNGNMTFDPHKDITITYNFLNLPSQIVKTGAGGGTMSLTYDAAGRKWRKQVTGVTKDYCQGIEYKDGKVEAVYGQEGRLTAVYDQYGVTLTSFRAEYWLKDHLGNTRLAFSDENHNGTIEVWDDPSTQENEAEIVQENHYYPFGMNQEGPWYGTIGPRNGYQYNGKELNEELDLDWNDFGARWQDPATGRWWQVDPSSEKYFGYSPFSFAMNNPLRFVDPDGRDAVATIDKEKKEILVSQTFHASRVNFNSNLSKIPNKDASGRITTEEFVTNLYNEFANQWGGVETANIEGQDYSVSFSASIQFHDTDQERNQAVNSDRTSNSLVLDRNLTSSEGVSVQGLWERGHAAYNNEVRRLSLNPLTMIEGTFSHEIAHSLGIKGHIKGSGQISSYDDTRIVKPEEVQQVLLDAVRVSQNVNSKSTKVHLKGHTEPVWKAYDPIEIIKN